MGGGRQLPSFPGEGAGRVYYSFGGAPAQIHINTAQPGVLRYRFINTRGALPRRIAGTKAASPLPRTARRRHHYVIAPRRSAGLGLPEALGTRGRRRYMAGGGLSRLGGCARRRGDSGGRRAGGGSTCRGVLTPRAPPPTPERAAWRRVNPCVAGAACCSWDGGPQRQNPSPPPPSPPALWQAEPGSPVPLLTATAAVFVQSSMKSR